MLTGDFLLEKDFYGILRDSTLFWQIGLIWLDVTP
jgi:hypothetical protein